MAANCRLIVILTLFIGLPAAQAGDFLRAKRSSKSGRRVHIYRWRLTDRQDTQYSQSRSRRLRFSRVRRGVATPVARFDSRINAMRNNNMTFLTLQTKVQSVSRAQQMMSNIAKADSDAKLAAIRNLRQ